MHEVFYLCSAEEYHRHWLPTWVCLLKNTREMQSFCAFLFHDIFNQWMFTGTSIQIRRFTFLSNEIFHIIVLSDLDCARILAINNLIRPSASNGTCKWQSLTVVQITIILRYIHRCTFSSVMTLHSYTFSWLIKNETYATDLFDRESIYFIFWNNTTNKQTHKRINNTLMYFMHVLKG